MNDLIITNKGQELMSKLIAGTSTCTFTKIQTSDYDYSGESLVGLTALDNVKQTSNVSSVSKLNISQVEVFAGFNNTDLASGYYVKAIGLYAKDSDDVEILYGIAIDTENPDYMPAAGNFSTGIDYIINVKVSNSEQVSVVVDPAAVATVSQVNTVSSNLKTHTDDTDIHVTSEDKTTWNNKAETKTYSGTLPVDGWIDNTGFYTREVSVSGILATDNPIIDLVTTTEGFEAEQDAWNKIFKAVTSANTITFYASEVPGTAVTFKAKVVR